MNTRGFDEDGNPTHAWLHQCGHLNAGEFHPDNWPGERGCCGGCLFEIKHETEVIGRFKLIAS